MWIAPAFSLVAVVYNNSINRWEPFRKGAYVPVNLTFAALFAGTAVLALSLSPDDLGLRADVGDLTLPLLALTPYTLGAFVLARTRYGRFIADERMADLRGSPLAYYVLVRIPVGTAVTEEIVFRGVLPAAWGAGGTSAATAAIASSLAFGLWHIAPTIDAFRVNKPEAGRQEVLGGVLGAVAFTTAAGLGLMWLRIDSGSLLGPVVLHAGINSIGALAAVAARRRTAARPR